MSTRLRLQIMMFLQYFGLAALIVWPDMALLLPRLIEPNFLK